MHKRKHTGRNGRRCRSAVNGQFVTEDYANKHPKTTVKEKIK